MATQYRPGSGCFTRTSSRLRIKLWRTGSASRNFPAIASTDAALSTYRTDISICRVYPDLSADLRFETPAEKDSQSDNAGRSVRRNLPEVLPLVLTVRRVTNNSARLTQSGGQMLRVTTRLMLGSAILLSSLQAQVKDFKTVDADAKVPTNLQYKVKSSFPVKGTGNVIFTTT